MIDSIDYQYAEQPLSGYELLVEKDNSNAKEKALNSLKELHGWCTPHKATLLMDIIYMMKPQTVVEIGVFGGASLVPMAFALKDLGGGKVYGIDPWDRDASLQGMTGVNQEWWGSLNHEAIYQSLVAKINEYDLSRQIELIRTTSAAAPEIYGIDVIHIDGNHSDEASFIDVTKWVPFVRKGGLIIFDDMTWGTNGRAVQWLDTHCQKFAEFHETSVWGIWVKQ